jgi:hypothetical protein
MNAGVKFTIRTNLGTRHIPLESPILRSYTSQIMRLH